MGWLKEASYTGEGTVVDHAGSVQCQYIPHGRRKERFTSEKVLQQNLKNIRKITHFIQLMTQKNHHSDLQNADINQHSAHYFNNQENEDQGEDCLKFFVGAITRAQRKLKDSETDKSSC